MATDPVCGMTVDEARAAGKSVYQGATYHFCSTKCLQDFRANPASYVHAGHEAVPMKLAVGPGHAGHGHTPPASRAKPAKGMAKDPICGMVVDKSTALKSERAGRAYYFCSSGCQRTFESPEAELKAMKTRVTVALTGVLALALLRAGAFLFLATGAAIVTWAPIPALPWFTWGMWLLILVTPVQFIGGWGFYKGTWTALKTRTINMDTLIALGTSVAYFYSVVVVFFPEVLPVKVEERDVYFEVSAVIIAFVLLGKYMEEMIKKRSSAAVRKLMDLKPAQAHVVRDGVEMDVPAESVMVGEVVIVKPGEKVPTDGEVIEGSSAVDESMLTGESMPVAKKPGAAMIGGTLNKTGLLRFKATRVGSETALAQIIKLVEEAQASTAPIQRIADQVTGYFVPAVVITAFVAFAGWWLAGNFPQGLLAFIAVLIIACPCALGIATPAALMVGVGKGAEAGILIRGGEVLERARKLTTVVFDKTGTLTRGEPNVTDIVPLGNLGEAEAATAPNQITGRTSAASRASESARGPVADVQEARMPRRPGMAESGLDPIGEVLRLAASVEVGSEHPLGEAIVRAAKHRNLELPKVVNFEAIPGHGIRGEISPPPHPSPIKGEGGAGGDAQGAHRLTILLGNRRLFRREGIDASGAEAHMTRLESEGKTAMLVAADGRLAGVIAVADTLKPEAAEAIAALKGERIEVILLTGDNQRTADAIAKELGIDHVVAEVLPADKAKVIQELQKQGKVVAMVGDGVNDAPALAVADIGIAIGSGSDVAKETGGIILMRDDVREVVTAIRLSRLTLSKIKQNLFWAFVYNSVGIPIAALGFLNPIIAAAAMALSSLSVIVNSALLKLQRLGSAR